MSGGSDSANEIWKPWPGWKSEPAACVLRTTTRIATGSRGEFRWLRALVIKSARQSRSLVGFLLSVSGRAKAMTVKSPKEQWLQMAVATLQSARLDTTDMLYWRIKGTNSEMPRACQCLLAASR